MTAMSWFGRGDLRRLAQPGGIATLVMGLATWASLGCQPSGAPNGAGRGAGGSGGAADPGGTPVDVAVPDLTRTAFTDAQAQLANSRPKDAAAFLARWQTSYLEKLPYDPATAVNLPLIQTSHLQLNDGELGVFGSRGFVISGRQQFKTFFEGYRAIYSDDLPVFVSADSILHAVHRSYDKILATIEDQVLIGALRQMLEKMHAGLATAGAGGAWPAETLADVDEYLTVARRLLDDGTPAPVAGGSPTKIAELVMKATAGADIDYVELFGIPEKVMDFSQFTPRGHYAGIPQREKYFRSSMWLGRTDLQLIKQSKAGDIRFFRRSFAAAALLASLVQAAGREWQMLDETLRAFVGESDNMLPADFQKLARALEVARVEDLLAKSDADLAQALVRGGFGVQRIASQILFVVPGNEGAPLDRAFLLLGQRFVIDSQVLSNVVYDRVPETRMMPSPLDVGFAALGNDRAADLLRLDLERFPTYAGALHDARVLVDQHEPGFWQGSLYSAWMNALRAFSPRVPAASAGTAASAPAVTRTEAWARRVLGAQLASWAELRHDTLLYAKQSYTAWPVCEFPDAYVEPKPELWAALEDYGKRGEAVSVALGLTGANLATVPSYFRLLTSVAGMLKAMAERQLTGEAFTPEQLAFVNEAVELKRMSVGCASVDVPAGWYPRLFFDPNDSNQADTIVADVHTQPADEGGNKVGYVLHVGTGYPRLMVTTFETCTGPRAYAGVVSSYSETITENFERLTDAQWTQRVDGGKTTPVPWLTDVTR